MDAAASSRSRRPKRRSPTPAAAPPTTTPSPKIFLDTTWLIAKYIDNLLDELWNYIKEGKLAETAVLLLAAQEQIRKGTSLKRNGDSKPDRFAIIHDRILNNNITLHSEKDQQVEARIRLNNMALMLVHVISKAGEGLDSYIQKHLEVPHFMQVPHSEVIERVSSILKDNGFCPTSEWIEIGNLSPYEDVLNSAIDMGQWQRRRRHRHGAVAASTTTLTRAAAASTTTSTWGYCGVDDEIDTEQCCLKLHY